jgi:hypothetical protein
MLSFFVSKCNVKINLLDSKLKVKKVHRCTIVENPGAKPWKVGPWGFGLIL